MEAEVERKVNKRWYQDSSLERGNSSGLNLTSQCHTHTHTHTLVPIKDGSLTSLAALLVSDMCWNGLKQHTGAASNNRRLILRLLLTRVQQISRSRCQVLYLDAPFQSKCSYFTAFSRSILPNTGFWMCVH